MAHPGLPGGVGRPCAIRSVALSGCGPRGTSCGAPRPNPRSTRRPSRHSTRWPFTKGTVQSNTGALQSTTGASQSTTGASQSTRAFPNHHGRSPIKRGRSPIKHVRFPNKHGRFQSKTGSSQSYPGAFDQVPADAILRRLREVFSAAGLEHTVQEGAFKVKVATPMGDRGLLRCAAPGWKWRQPFE